MKTDILVKLQKIQANLKAPKNLYNKFGKYKYRNAESILEAFKPYGEEYKCSLVIDDDIIVVGERYYVKATATLYDIESGESIKATAMARESVTKKGMDDSQVTGATSSYARKYCLNGLFLLDDTKDADTDEYTEQTNNAKEHSKNEKAKKNPNKLCSPEEIEEIKSLLDEEGVSEEGMQELCNIYKINSLDDLTLVYAKHIKDNLKRVANMIHDNLIEKK